jgi:hypothetical protein
MPRRAMPRTTATIHSRRKGDMVAMAICSGVENTCNVQAKEGEHNTGKL